MYGAQRWQKQTWLDICRYFDWRPLAGGERRCATGSDVHFGNVRLFSGKKESGHGQRAKCGLNVKCGKVLTCSACPERCSRDSLSEREWFNPQWHVQVVVTCYTFPSVPPGCNESLWRATCESLTCPWPAEIWEETGASDSLVICALLLTIAYVFLKGSWPINHNICPMGWQKYV